MTIEVYYRNNGRAIQREDPFFQFPGGEWHMKPVRIPFSGQEAAWVSGTDVNDYVKLALWGDAVRQSGGKSTVYIPYLPAARADRGIPFGAKVYSDLILTSRPDVLACYDPHSPVMVKLLAEQIDTFGTFGMDAFTARAFFGKSYVGVIAPDKGAVDRAHRIANLLGVPCVEAGKDRDFVTGELLGFTCPDLASGRWLVADDICDGGGTFIGLADIISRNSNVILDLFVSHGIFSKGLVDLFNYYDNIITTNSLEQKPVPANYLQNRFRVIDIKTTMIGQ